MAEQTINADFNTLTGAAAGGVVVAFRKLEVRGSDGAVILGGQEDITADANGLATFTLEVGTYQMRYISSAGLVTAEIGVGAAGPYDLGNLIGAQVTPAEPAAIQEAKDAATEAKASATAAQRAQSVASISEKTASYTLADADKGTLIASTGASAVTVTIPTDATGGFTETVVISFQQTGTGTLSIAAASGVTLNGLDAGATEVQQRYGTAQIIRYGVNTWTIFGLTDEVA